MASLKYTNRIKEGVDKQIQQVQQSLKEDLQKLRNELGQAKIFGFEEIRKKENFLNNIETRLKENCEKMRTDKEYQEFVMECDILRKKLSILRNKPLVHESFRRRSASPLNDDITTDRESHLRQKVLILQSQNDSQLKKIEDMAEQIINREHEIKNSHKKISELERILYEKDRHLQETTFKNNENNEKLSEMIEKLNDYSKKFKILKASKSLNQGEIINPHEEILESQLLDLERKLVKEREESMIQINKLKQSIITKDRMISELQTSSNYCISEKEAVVSDLKQKLKTKTVTITDLEKQLFTLNNTYNEFKFKLDVEASSSKKYEEECLMLRKKHEELLSKFSTTDSKNLLLMQKCENLEKDLSFARQEADSRKYKTHQLCTSLKEMENTISVSSEEAQRIRFELKQLNSENQMLRLDKENLANENLELKEENSLYKAELKNLNNQLEDTNQYVIEKDQALLKIQSGEANPQYAKKKKKKIKSLKEKVSVLEQQLKECQSIAEEEIKKILDEKDQILLELDECKGSQIHDLSLVENQVGIIEEQLIKLKEQNKLLMAKEAELFKEIKNAENGKEKYKTIVVELKEEIKVLQNQLAEMDEFAKDYIENHRKEISEMKIGDEKAILLKSRIRAMHDVKNLIQAHRVQR